MWRPRCFQVLCRELARGGTQLQLEGSRSVAHKLLETWPLLGFDNVMVIPGVMEE